ncbi:MAG TPA: hypothetical protein VM597_03630 [Gemmataceae bacterium]|jgi:hypothetical protein|nr:hypothetical protein [Gemmataceae bacterium]
MSWVRWYFALPIAVVCGVGPGCSAGGPTLHPVRGTVLFNEQPAEGATVILDPVAAAVGTAKPSGVVKADGTFSVQTHPLGEGAPAGEYVVLITWYPPGARGLENPKNKLPAKYGDPGGTPVPKITVRPGRNDLEPFRLAGK